MEGISLTKEINNRNAVESVMRTFNGFMGLSQKEFDVLCALMETELQYRMKDLVSVPGVSTFSSDSRKAVYGRLGIKSHQFNNLIAALKKKKAILGGKDLHFNPWSEKVIESLLKGKGNMQVNFKFVYSR